MGHIDTLSRGGGPGPHSLFLVEDIFLMTPAANIFLGEHIQKGPPP